MFVKTKNMHLILNYLCELKNFEMTMLCSPQQLDSYKPLNKTSSSQESIEKKETDVKDSIAYLCAYNFPAICYNVGSRLVLESGLLDVLTSLSSHHHFSVRRVLAAGIHEVR